MSKRPPPSPIVAPIALDGGVHHVADPIAAAAAAEAAEQHQEPATKVLKLGDTVEESATVNHHLDQHDDDDQHRDIFSYKEIDLFVKYLNTRKSDSICD